RPPLQKVDDSANRAFARFDDPPRQAKSPYPKEFSHRFCIHLQSKYFRKGGHYPSISVAGILPDDLGKLWLDFGVLGLKPLFGRFAAVVAFLADAEESTQGVD